jgi:hypothetical protein
MDDLYPSEFEVLIGSLVVLFREEKDVDAKIHVNSEDIKVRVQKELIVSASAGEAETDVSQCSVATGVEGPSETTSAEPEETYTEIECDQTDILPLAKKLFKQVALHTHPDKVKDEKLNKLFLVGRKAQEQNDIITLLFILSRFQSKDFLDDAEIRALKAILDERHAGLIKKKDSVTYKWNTYSEEVKQVLIKHLV